MPPKAGRKKAKSKRASSTQRWDQLVQSSDDEAVADSKDQQADDDRDSDAKSAYDAGGKGIISILRNRNRSEELPHDHDHHHHQANLTLSTTYPIKPGEASEKTAGRKSARISRTSTKRRGTTKVITDVLNVASDDDEDEAQEKGPAKGHADQDAMDEEGKSITNVRL
jgi:hypothetical protein